MARFADITDDIVNQPSATKRWEALKTAVEAAKSVELLVVPGDDGEGRIVVREWLGRRKDKSNTPQASEDKDY
jgi:hypothetical protein